MKNKISTTPQKELGYALLPYPIQFCAAREMLYGGIRIQGLIQKPPKLSYLLSQRIKLPSPLGEWRDMRLDFENTSVRMIPVNIGTQTRFDMSINRNQDVYKRFLIFNRGPHPLAATMNGSHVRPLGLASEDSYVANGKSTGPDTTFAPAANAAVAGASGTDVRRAMINTRTRRMYHVKKDQLSITGFVDRVVEKEEAFKPQPRPNLSTVGSTVFGLGGENQFMPFQMVKPVAHEVSPAQRSNGRTNPAGRLKQELLDRKGFGWQKKQRKLWQQDESTRGFRPDKFY